MLKLAKYVRNCVVFWENLHSWQKFYTTTGRGGGDKFQLCTAPHMMYICMYQTEKGPNEVNKFLFFGFVPMGKKKHLFRPAVERRGPQVLSTDFSLFKYCSLVFAILKSHFEFELDPSSVFVEQLKLWICCDFKDSRFSKQQVYSRLIWVLLRKLRKLIFLVVFFVRIISSMSKGKFG